jgi:hypothetical protein
MRRLSFVSGLLASLLLVSVVAFSPGAGAATRSASPVAASAAGSPMATTVGGRVGAAVSATTPVRLPPNGSFIRARNRVWRLVGRALVYVPPWAPYGGIHRTLRLTAVQYAAISGSRIRDGEFIRTIQDGRVYRVVGGAPIYLSSWAAVGGRHLTTSIDATNLRHAGQGTRGAPSPPSQSPSPSHPAKGLAPISRAVEPTAGCTH